MKGRIAAAHGR